MFIVFSKPVVYHVNRTTECPGHRGCMVIGPNYPGDARRHLAERVAHGGFLFDGKGLGLQILFENRMSRCRRSEIGDCDRQVIRSYWCWIVLARHVRTCRCVRGVARPNIRGRSAGLRTVQAISTTQPLLETRIALEFGRYMSIR